MTATKMEQELIDMEHKYWQAIKNKDVNAAMALTDTSCVVAGASGVASIKREAFAGMLNSSAWTLNKFEFVGDVQVRLLTDDVAVVAYKVKEQLTVDGKPLTLEAADASTWVRRDGWWLCALHTEATIGDPFGRDRQRATRP